MKYWESSLRISAKPDLAWAGSQLSILKGAQFGLLMRIVTESVSLGVRIKKLLAFVERQSAIRDGAKCEITGKATDQVWVRYRLEFRATS